MGAELLIAFTPLCRFTQARDKAFRQLIDGLTPDDLYRFIECLGDELDDDGASEDGKVETSKKHLLGQVDDLAKAVESHESDICRWEGMDFHVLITGGLSWGDAPTELFDLFNQFAAVEALWEQLLEWAREDFRNKVFRNVDPS